MTRVGLTAGEEEEGSLEGTEDTRSEAASAAAPADPQAAARAAFMGAGPGEAYSSDEEEGGKANPGQSLPRAASDASFTSTSTAAQQQRFKVGRCLKHRRQATLEHCSMHAVIET